MVDVVGTAWPSTAYCMSAEGGRIHDSLAAAAYDHVCRVDFSSPGFCLIDLGGDATSTSLRRFMVDLKRSLQLIHRARQDRDLAFLSAVRFDQQVTTKFHRDGGPDECFLMLGYERSDVRATVAIADYSKCAHAMNLTPRNFLERHNPMYGPGEVLLRPYTTTVACFTNCSSQVLLINNSIASYQTGGSAWQGVLHTASILNPSDDARRIINSTMIASVPIGALEPVADADQEEFVTTTVVRRRGYDKEQLSDDN